MIKAKSAARSTAALGLPRLRVQPRPNRRETSSTAIEQTTDGDNVPSYRPKRGAAFASPFSRRDGLEGCTVRPSHSPRAGRSLRAWTAEMM
jgi:hypothetical protein